MSARVGDVVGHAREPFQGSIASKFRPRDGFMRERYRTAFWPSRYTSFLRDKGFLTT
jgi:hypothetical protein